MAIETLGLVLLPVNIHHPRNLLLCLAVFPIPLPWILGHGDPGRVSHSVRNAWPTFVPRQAVDYHNTQNTDVIEIVNNVENWIWWRGGRRLVTFWRVLAPS